MPLNLEWKTFQIGIYSLKNSYTKTLKEKSLKDTWPDKSCWPLDCKLWPDELFPSKEGL